MKSQPTGVISGVSPSWVDALPGGTLVTQTVDGLAEDTAYHWRTRLVYRPGNRLGQPAGRWIHGAWNGQQETDFRTAAVISPTWRVISYTYDPLGRLTEADYSTGERFEYAYDEVGNRVAATVTLGVVGTPEVANYVYDDANRLTSVDGQTYIWDDNGNLISGGGKTYSYDQPNRLTGVSGSGLAWSAAYNGDGARLSQTANGQVVSYTLDLAAPLVTVLAERAGDDTTYYLYAHGTRPLAQYLHLGEGEWTHLLPDGLGSVRIETDGAGEVTAWRAFDPYGALLEGNESTPFGFTGEMWDDDTALVFLRARYMQPELGMFLSRDPLILSSPYRYASSNPVNRVDPSGCIDCSMCQQEWASMLADYNYCECTVDDESFTWDVAEEIVAGMPPAWVQAAPWGRGGPNPHAISAISYEIKQFNGLNNSSLLYPGQPLFLKGTWIKALLGYSVAPTPLPREIPNGYLEGTMRSLTGFFCTMWVQGKEIVYDFAAMPPERARFEYSGLVRLVDDFGLHGPSSSLFDASGSLYFGLVTGFDTMESRGVEEYQGVAFTVSGGGSVTYPLPWPPGLGIGAGLGVGAFHSPGTDIGGVIAYAQAGIGAITNQVQSYSLVLTKSTMVGDPRRYDGEDRVFTRLDLLGMGADILSGSNSPIPPPSSNMIAPYIGIRGSASALGSYVVSHNYGNLLPHW